MRKKEETQPIPNPNTLEIHPKPTAPKPRKIKTWSTAQDELLLSLHSAHPKKWSTIASLMPDRNENQCLHRYRRLAQLGTQKKIWSAKEDEAVLTLLKKIGKNWKVLSQMIGSKTGKQIRERFINKLDPKIKMEEWSQEEDRLVLKYYTEFGSRWSEISKRLAGRPENKIKNRFYSYIRKNYEVRYGEASRTEPTNQESVQMSQQAHSPQISTGNEPKRNQKPPKTPENSNPNPPPSQPSLKQLPEHPQPPQNNHQDPQNGLQSLIKVDQELPLISQSRYRSVRSLASQQEMEMEIENQNQNDLFFMYQ